MLAESSYTRSATLAGKPLTGLVDARKALALFDDGRDDRVPGPAPLLAAADPAGRGARARARPPLPGQRLPDPAGLPGLRGPLRQPRRVRLPDRRRQAVGGAHRRRRRGPHCSSPGLCVYLPTGTPHAARAQETVSLHVTLGINQLTWRGLIRRSVAALLDEVPDDHLPAGYLDDPAALADGLADRLAALADRMRGVDAARRRRRRGTPLPHRPHAPARRRPPRRDPARATSTTPPCCAAGPATPASCCRRGDRLEVLLGDRVPRRPRAGCEPALDEIRRRPELRPADLAEHLDEQSRLVLCRRLVREGLLEIVA